MDLCVRFDPLFQESAIEDEEDVNWPLVDCTSAPITNTLKVKTVYR